MSTIEPTQGQTELPLRSICNEGEYDDALAHVDALMSAEAGTPEMAELDLWVHLVQMYEEEKYPIAPPDPITAIRFRAEQEASVPQPSCPTSGGCKTIRESADKARK